MGEDGKLLTSELPAVAVTETFQIASQAAMLALAAHKGSIAIRSDVNKTFVLASDDPAVLANWKEILAPNAVASVAGRTGAVILSAEDVGGLSASATTDTTNASNISSGTLSNTRLSGVALTANNLSDVANAATARANLGLGSIATQSASAVSISGGAVTGLGAPSSPTDAATKAYVDALATLVSGALVFKGAWDASAGTFPGGGVAQTGWFYKVSVAGTVNGVAFDAGDDIYAVTNNASPSTYINNWLRIDGVVSSAEITTALGYTPLSQSANLSDLGSVGMARASLGLVASATTDTTNAANISAGSLADARLSSNVPLKNVTNTFTAGQIVSGAALTLSGNQSAATWGTSGLRLVVSPGTFTDTSASGTVTAAFTDMLGGDTIAASNARTFTNYYSLFITQPTAGNNVTFTRAWALGLSGNLDVAGRGRFSTGVEVTGTLASGLGAGLSYNGGALRLRSLATDCAEIGVFNGTYVWVIGDSSYIAFGATFDAFICRDAANTLGQRNGTSAQKNNIYATFTSATNYERLSLDAGKTTTNVHRLMAEKGSGGGTLRPIAIDGYSKSSAMANTDIPQGTWALFKDTSSGAVVLGYNDGGTLKTVTLS